ncbi:MAG: glycosyltransferase family 4 protein [Gemmatimonadota bacterium]
MKILVIAPQPFFTDRGTPIAVRAAVDTLGRDGHEIDLLTLFEGRDLSIPGVTIHRTSQPPFVRHVPVGLSWQKALSDLWLAASARRLIAAGRYDVIHGVEEGAILACALSAWSGVPFVYDMDSVMSAQIMDKSRLLWPLARIMILLEKVTIRRSAGVLAVCPALAEVARKHQDDERVFLLPDTPLHEDMAAAKPAEEVRAIGGTRILYVGNLEKYQGVDLLLDAFVRLAKRDANAHLVIVGGSEAHIAEYARSFAERDGGERIHFLGPRPLEQLPSVLAAADILVSPRLQGINTPLKIDSYLASGRPVVATRLVPHTQVLDEDVALLVDVDPDSMADGLGRLRADPELRCTLGAAGQKFVQAFFGRDRFEDRLRFFYSRLEEQLKRPSGDRHR